MLPDRNSVNAVWEQLNKAYKLQIERVRDYNERPHAGGYRALHLWCRRDGFKVEVQLRTARQQDWAATVEEFDSTLRTDLKHEYGPDVLVNYFCELADYFAKLDNNVSQSSIDMSALRAATYDIRAWLRKEAQDD